MPRGHEPVSSELVPVRRSFFWAESASQQFCSLRGSGGPLRAANSCHSPLPHGQARAATKAFIKAKLRVELTDGEKKLAEPRSVSLSQPDSGEEHSSPLLCYGCTCCSEQVAQGQVSECRLAAPRELAVAATHLGGGSRCLPSICLQGAPPDRSSRAITPW